MRLMKHIGISILTLMSVILLGGCNDKDDIMEIFVSGEWTMVNIFPGADLNITNKFDRPKYNPNQHRDQMERISQIKVLFNDDGTVNVRTATNKFNGTWYADPKKREVDIKLPHRPNLSGVEKEFVDILETATLYSGDSNYLRLAPDRGIYIQMCHQ